MQAEQTVRDEQAEQTLGQLTQTGTLLSKYPVKETHLEPLSCLKWLVGSQVRQTPSVPQGRQS